MYLKTQTIKKRNGKSYTYYRLAELGALKRKSKENCEVDMEADV